MQTINNYELTKRLNKCINNFACQTKWRNTKNYKNPNCEQKKII